MTALELLLDDIVIVESVEPISAVNAEPFHQQIGRLIEAGVRRIIVDLRTTPYLTSAGFRQLTRLGVIAQARGCSLAVCSGPASFGRLIALADPEGVVSVCETRQAAVALVKPANAGGLVSAPPMSEPAAPAEVSVAPSSPQKIAADGRAP